MSVQVNSMHHQGINRLADTLQANAWAPDGLIEGVEGLNGQFLLGVQWHPEELTRRDDAMTALFRAFLHAATEYHLATVPTTTSQSAPHPVG